MLPFEVSTVGKLRPNVGDLVKSKFSSITADVTNATAHGIIIKYNKILSQPYLVKWFFDKGDKHLDAWEMADDFIIISSGNKGI